jgi:signal transduction histidine kinase
MNHRGEKTALPGELLTQLREANSHLVIAAVGAQQLQDSAEAARLRQEQFLTMLAHELRNPLAPIAMAGELLGKIADAHPQLPKLAAIITRQAAHMSHLVDDLLDASRISSGKISLSLARLNLADVIECALETARPLIHQRNQRLALHLPPEPVMLHGDMVRLAQVFANLLINAAKFSPEFETIGIDVTRHGSNGRGQASEPRDTEQVRIVIRDNGIGISANILPGIFDLFTQGFQSLDRSQGGLGIGLSLVRTIVAQHGGTVLAESAGVGLGSEFTVCLPILRRMAPVGAALAGARAAVAAAAAATTRVMPSAIALAALAPTPVVSAPAALAPAAPGQITPAPVAFGPLAPASITPAPLMPDSAAFRAALIKPPGRRLRAGRILLIEDNPDNNATLSELLMLEGHLVDSVEGGVAALAQSARQQYDIIICDIGLPGMDGFEVAEALKKRDFRPAPCLIALSGYNLAENDDRARRAGFDHYLTKPVASGRLQDLIATWLDQ